MSDLLDAPVTTLQGEATTFGALTGGKPALVVNVASRCGLTPQYSQLEALQEEYGPRGFTVVGFPCNQFMGQEPGTAEEIREFCSTNYAVTFPMTEKIEVNGERRHDVYEGLVSTPDATGHSGDIRWNFEKFLIDGDGTVVARFEPRTEPDDLALVAAVEKLLPQQD